MYVEMEEEKLISIVQRYPFLYDVNHPKYSDTFKKERTWYEISKEVRQPAEICRQKWQNLRDALRRALNKRKSKKAGLSDKRCKKKWKYEDEMAFLIPYFNSRSYPDTVPSEQGEYDSEIYVKSEQYQEEPMTVEPDIDASHIMEYKPTIEEHFLTPLTKEPKHTTRTKIHKHKKRLKRKSSSTSILKTVLEDRKSSFENSELDLFFLSISATVKKFLPYQQAMAKKEVFSLISEMELQQFSYQANHSSSSSSSSSSNEAAEEKAEPQNTQ